jgi:hypothetical protein
MKARITVVVTLATLLAAAVAGSDDEWGAAAPDEATSAAIQRAVGNPDPGSLSRLASEASPPQLVAAIYRGARSERLTALEAAGVLVDPWPVLPFLAAVMGAPERQSASRATASLLADLDRCRTEFGDPSDLVPGQAEQLAEQLFAVAGNRRVDPDIRASALAAVAAISQIDGQPRTAGAELLGDAETTIRGAAMAMFEPPLPDPQLGLVAEMAAGDKDRILRGQAAGLLCENALAHGVKAPSPDLRKLLLALLGDVQAPPEGIAPILGCLARFPPAARADLIDVALRHPATEVRSYWEALIEQPF